MAKFATLGVAHRSLVLLANALLNGCANLDLHVLNEGSLDLLVAFLFCLA